MSLVLCLITGVLLLATLSYFWNNIREFLNTTLRDLIEKAFGTEWGNKFAELVVWLDKGIVKIKKTAQSAYQSCMDWFMQKFLRTEVKYDNIRGTTTTKTTTILIQLDNGMGQETTITETNVNWHELPDNVRAEAIREKADIASVDVKEIVEKQYQSKQEKLIIVQ
ncbi:MAG: hypothetical protein ACRC10_00745 [Thermoguttaceae bacterium]